MIPSSRKRSSPINSPHLRRQVSIHRATNRPDHDGPTRRVQQKHGVVQMSDKHLINDGTVKQQPISLNVILPVFVVALCGEAWTDFPMGRAGSRGFASGPSGQIDWLYKYRISAIRDLHLIKGQARTER